MRIALFAMIAVLIALPLMAKAYDNAAIETKSVQAITADMMDVIADINIDTGAETMSPEITAMAKALNDLTVGSVQ